MSRLRDIDGLPVLDAKRPLTLKITKGDIAKAATNIKEPRGCAVARACMRELHVKEARVHLSRIYLRTNDSNWVRYMTPPELRTEIVSFDRGGAFEPCEVWLAPCYPSDQVRVRRGGTETSRPTTDAGRKVRAKASGKARKPYHRIENVRAGPA